MPTTPISMKNGMFAKTYVKLPQFKYSSRRRQITNGKRQSFMILLQFQGFRRFSHQSHISLILPIVVRTTIANKKELPKFHSRKSSFPREVDRKVSDQRCASLCVMLYLVKISFLVIRILSISLTCS